MVLKTHKKVCPSEFLNKFVLKSFQEEEVLYLDGTIGPCGRYSMVDVCLLSRADATIDGVDQLSTNQLKEDHPRLWIHDLLGRCSVVFVLHSRSENHCQATIYGISLKKTLQ